MKKVFLRYFISILCIAIIVMALQMGILYAKYYVSQEKWKEQVYEDFVTSVEDSIASGRFADYGINTIYQLTSAIDDDRVSGFLLRDASGSNMVSFGMTPNGRTLTSFFSGNAFLSDGGVQKKVKKHVDIAILTNGFGRFVSATAEGSSESYNVTLPKSMKDEEIIGSISISIDGREAFIIDLLTYSPMTYEYSKDIIRSCYKGFLVSIPICLIFALLSAWIISSSNAKYINDVRKALSDLSHGKPNVKLPPRSYGELDEITTAIEDLDRDLQANAKSRKAWLRSISHDLNTPVTAMKMMIEGMSDGVFPMDSTTVQSLRKEVDTLSERIGKVTDFSTLQADTVAALEKIPCQGFVDSVLCNINDSQKINVELNVQDIVCDASLMARAVTELLDNAIDANGQDNGLIKWTIDCENENYVMAIENAGHLASDMSADFFEPWTRGDWSRTKGGSGLGLPIAVTILYLHKGTISLRNAQADMVRCEIRWPKA